MSTPQATILLKYANLQMAAEALLDRPGPLSGLLGLGNDRASRFPTLLAQQFVADQWTVVAHQPNTPTGFSGTLFKYNGQDDPARGLVNGELVLSFRSTEFADDAARDNEATNTLEVRPFGFAFGQIADMEKWYAELKTSGALPAGARFAVTGYSLGGHLATAFNMLRAEASANQSVENPITQTYTFNGAGVGTVLNGASLTSVLDQFRTWSTSDQASYFTTTEVQTFYNRFRSDLNGTATLSQRRDARAEIYTRIQSIGASPDSIQANLVLYKELKQLFEAVDRGVKVCEEAIRAAGKPSGSPESPQPAARIEMGEIVARGLDYQLAVLRTSQLTQAFRSGIKDMYDAAYDVNRARIGIGGVHGRPVFDVYGAPLPSAVANSQYHLGEPVPVFIEDQPLYRGNYFAKVLWESNFSLLQGELKLLVDNFAINDFGDTHSLVLLVDSLNVQSLLAGLDPTVDQATLNRILQAASNLKRQEGRGQQGKAEGDVLENVLDGLRRMILGPGVDATTANTDGGTWAKIADRNAFYSNQAQLTDPQDPAYASIRGKVVVRASAGDGELVSRAKTDFASLLALLTLSPASLASKDAASSSAVELALKDRWQAEYTNWQADKGLSASQRSEGLGVYSDAFLADRQGLLQAINTRNLRNADGTGIQIQGLPERTIYKDLDPKSGQRTVDLYPSGSPPVGSDYIDHAIFGTRASEGIEGKQADDRLYGGAGNDTITGFAGKDYLEGNDDSDQLDGGDNADTLLGGAGADTLKGGAGNDILSGGKDADVYIVDANSGYDTILSSEAADSLQLGGRSLNGAGTIESLSADGSRVWIDKSIAANPIFYTFDAASAQLTVYGYGSTVLIKDYESGDLGITMPGDRPPAPAVPATSAAPFNDTTTPYYNQTHTVVSAQGRTGLATAAIGDYGEVWGDGVLVGNLSDNHLLGGDGADWLIGDQGRDVLTSKDGADTLEGGLNDDALAGGAGDDSLFGGDGNDVITSGTGADSIQGGDGRDIIFAGGTVYTQVHDWSVTFGVDSIQWSGFGNGYLYVADDGADFVDAGAGDDFAWGGEGNDTLLGGSGIDQLSGDMGDDDLRGGADDDNLFGDVSQTSGPNYFTLEAYHGLDVLYGGAGNDKVQGDGQSDTLFGDAGNDTLWGDASGGGLSQAYLGKDVLDGGIGDDLLIGNGDDDTLYGGAGNDDLHGDDRFASVAHGKDLLDGGDGNDTISGDGKDDVLFGGSGDDQLFGDADDVAVAERGNDAMYGEAGNDYLRGYEGNDYLDGGDGVDQLLGDAGDDTLVGGTGNDTLEGSEGNDVLVGGAGVDLLMGGAGDDTYVMDASEALGGPGQFADTIFDSQGKNRIVIANGSKSDVSAQVAVGDLQVYSAGGAFVVAGALGGGSFDFELVDGSKYSTARFIGNFTDSGTRGSGFDFGGRGNDQIELLSGGGRISGGQGDDVLIGSGGNNTYFFSAGDGRDSIRDTSSKTDAQGVATPNQLVFEQGYTADSIKLKVGTGINGGQAGDLVLQLGDYGDAVGIGGFQSTNALATPQIDTFTFEDGTTLTYAELLQRGFDIEGTAASEDLTGTNLTDRFAVSEGNDTLRGGAGADRYAFDIGTGIDLIDDGMGQTAELDTIAVGTGLTAIDLILNRTGDDLLIRVRGGVDQIVVHNHFVGGAIERIEFSDGSSWDSAGITAHITNELTDAADNFTGTANPDVIDGKGGNDTLRGADGADIVDGGLGNDSITGGNGNDTLYGGDGTDTLVGDAGDDWMDGGAGNDSLSGGTGNNTYLFGRGDGSDVLSTTPSDTNPLKLNAVRFKPGILPGDVTVRQDGNTMQLILGIAGTTDSITVSGFFGGEAATLNPLQQIRFADGTTWAWSDITTRALTGTAASEYLYGTPSADTMSGGAGNDYLSGAGGNDVLDGGAGTDSLDGGLGDDMLIDGESMYGGDGHDTYVVNAWPSSTLTISDTSGVDELILPAGVTPQAISVKVAYSSGSLRNDALSLSLASGSSIQIEGYFAAQAADSIELIRFADGTVWGRADVMSRVPSARLSDANDQSIIGYVWNDSLDALGGNDSVYGRQGDDTLFGGAGQDSLYGDQGSDSVSGGAGDDSLFGDSEQYTSTGDGNDQIAGGDGNDSLYGAGGRDTLDGGAGADYVYGGDGDDVYSLSRTSGNDNLYDSSGTDRVVFGADVAPSAVTLWRDGVDLIIAVDQTILQARFLSHFSSSANTLDSIQFSDGTVWDAAAIMARTTSGTANAMTGTAGNDVFVVDNAGDTINETLGGTDTVQSSVSWTLGANVENLTLTGFLNLRGTGNSLNNVITGNSGSNVLDGLAGVDTLIGGAGDDTYNVVPGEDTIVEALGGGVDTAITTTSYALPDNVENLKLTPYAYSSVTATGNALNNVISISGSQTYGNVINGGAGADTMIFSGFGGAIFYVDDAGDVISATGGGHSAISSIDWNASLIVANVKLTGLAKNAVGNSGNNVLIGSGLGGQLRGMEGDDTLYSDYQTSYTFPGTGFVTSWSSLGADTLTGGTGNDTYYIFSSGGVSDSVVENAEEGVDTVYISGEARTFDITEFANVENLRLQAGTAASLIGGAGANQLHGNTSSNLLDGGAGNDYINDGGAGAVAAIDNDILRGGDGDDQLESWYGNDTLEGGAGNDRLDISANNSIATILFGRGDGADTVNISGVNTRRIVLGANLSLSDLQVSRNQRDLVLSFGLGDSITVTNYFADGTTTTPSGLITRLEFADGLQFTEQMLVNRLTSGNSNLPTEAADLIIGSSGPDAFDGLGGDDWILGAGGADSLLGGAGADTLAAGDGDDTLAGGLAADLLQGGAGSDTYRFASGDGFDTVEDSAGVDVVEFASGIAPSAVTVSRSGDDLQMLLAGGTDRVTLKGFFASASSEIESVRFADGTIWTLSMLKEMGTQIVGTAGPDSLSGSAADERLSGMAGNDTLNGAAGNDSLDGGDGDDSLIGGAGLDTLTGGAGNDAIDPGTEFDIIRFGRGYGSDRITGFNATGDEIQFDTGVAPTDLKFSYSGANLVIGINGTADSLTVEQFVNYWNQVTLRFADGTTWTTAQVWQALTTFTGTEAADIINGTANGDRIYANGGNDTVDGFGGNDLIEGGAGDDSLTGGAGYDTLNGGLGIDRMTGGTEDDYYVVDNTSDVVVELSGGGNDSVESSVTYTLPTNVESLSLTGTGNIAGTGNVLANFLSGNAGNTTLGGASGDDNLSDYDGGNDSLDGGAGGDYMEAGIGDDTYVVDSTLDQVYEYAGEGNDLAKSSINYVLPDEVERLTLTGTSNLTGTGNILANVLTGNSGANRLDGGDGNDTIDGGTGNDTMIGGAGNDVYFVNVSTDVVTEALNGGNDTINSSVTLTIATNTNVENLTLTGGTAAISGTGNVLANTLIGNSGNNSLTGGDGDDTIDGGLGNDSMVGGLGNDTFYINVSTDVVTEAASAGTDTVMAGITYTLLTNFENLTLTSTNAMNGTGNTVANALTGNGAANTLTGNAGNDTLDGAAGNDSLVGGTGADVYRFAAGYGIDTISENDTAANIKDAVQFVGAVTQANVQFKQAGNNLEVLLTGTSDKIVVQNWYLGTQYQVEEFRFTDGTILTNSQAQGKVTAGAVATAMSMSTLAEPAAGMASATGSKQIHMWRQPLAESSAFGAPAAAAMLGGVLALVNRAVNSEVPALVAPVGDVAPMANLPQWVQTMRRAWAPIASGAVSATQASGLLLGLMAKVNPADTAGADARVGLSSMVNSAMPAVRLLGLPVLGASVTAVTGGSAAAFVPTASAVAAISPVTATLQALAPESGLLVQSSDATPASQGNGRTSTPTSQGVHLDPLEPLASGLDWVGALMQRRMQDLPEVIGLQLHDAAADQPQWVRQASALVDAMAQFNAPAATAVGHSVAGSHVMLDKVTMPGLSV